MHAGSTHLPATLIRAQIANVSYLLIVDSHSHSGETWVIPNFTLDPVRGVNLDIVALIEEVIRYLVADLIAS